MRVKIATCGRADEHGDLFLPAAFAAPCSVPVTLDFDHMTSLGQATVLPVGDDGVVEADIELRSREELHGRFWPALGFRVNGEIRVNDERQILDVELLTVGLCRSRNVDPSVPPIDLP